MFRNLVSFGFRGRVSVFQGSGGVRREARWPGGRRGGWLSQLQSLITTVWLAVKLWFIRVFIGAI